ncbi:FHS family L-fucose permease-like MFS transporter [Novosphingobium sp. PhB165]|uniref:MFS transporter n=1 Tax=Novosphingobium sp. PhB165 TaxID=2485105 RepID=UPI001045A0A7|nr:MFS transporter [Novosphingobium sp. PhB165]TCM20535.1 FHS family L-fucose permease-like MFS transporter [Novosphingobium sp. PhB165]
MTIQSGVAALATHAPQAAAQSSVKAAEQLRAARVFNLSIGNCFMGGFVVSLVSLLVPRLKLLMGLDYTRASLVQLAFHSSYLLFALPVTAWLVRIGYMRVMALGCAIMAAGCLGFIAAAALHNYPLVLLALLALAGGITFLQIAGNVMVTLVEPADRAVPRITLLQGFNSIGTVLAPLLGASFLLSDRSVGHDAEAWLMVALPFIGCVVILLGIAWAYAHNRNLLEGTEPPQRVPLNALRCVVATPRLLAGSIAMFGYVGAEVTIGTLLTNYLVLPEIIGAEPVTAGRLVSLYWGGAMVGRFLGAAALSHWPPARVLTATALTATGLVAVAALGNGMLGAATLIAVGLCNSIMYPTLFALSLPDEQGAAPYASMALCMAVVGGAIVPMITAALADSIGLLPSLVVPGICYVVIAMFALVRGGYPAALARRMA